MIIYVDSLKNYVLNFDLTDFMISLMEFLILHSINLHGLHNQCNQINQLNQSSRRF